MKKYSDKTERIIMSNGNVMEVKYKSELLEQIRQDFEIMESESSDIDPGFFTEDDVWSLYEFLLMRHKDDWYVIDDMKDSDTEDSYYAEAAKIRKAYGTKADSQDLKMWYFAQQG